LYSERPSREKSAEGTIAIKEEIQAEVVFDEYDPSQ
jgi:hypothetical protein